MIIRTYACEECNLEFEVEIDSGEDGDPDCPNCAKVLDWVPGMFAVKTEKSRAVDYTQQVLEQDYGLTNFKDGSREGDTVGMGPAAMQTAEREKITQAVQEYVRETTTPVIPPQENQTSQAQAAPISSNFWGANGGISTNSVPAQMMLAGAKTGPYADQNPISMLQQGIKSGQIASKARIVARWRP